MKTNSFIFKGLLLVLIFCSFSPADSYLSENPFKQKTELNVSEDSVLGAWKYTMTNVDAPYEKGMFFITKKGDTFDVAVKLATGMLTGQDVIVQDKGINFNVNFEGLRRVSFVLKVSGDNIVGESYSANGTSEILAVRQFPEE